jgi:hypothetical protein
MKHPLFGQHGMATLLPSNNIPSSKPSRQSSQSPTRAWASESPAPPPISRDAFGKASQPLGQPLNF